MLAYLGVKKPTTLAVRKMLRHGTKNLEIIKIKIRL